MAVIGNFAIQVSAAGAALIQHESLAEIQEALGIDPIGIDELEVLSTLDNADYFPIVDATDGVTKRVTLATLATFLS